MITLEEKQFPGVPIVFNCAACNEQGVEGEACDLTIAAKLLYVIPLGQHRQTNVVCGSCEKSMRSLVPAAKLKALDAAGIGEQLVFGMKPTEGAKLMSILAFVLCLVPVVGLVLAIVAMYKARTADRGWAKSLNLLSAILSIVSTVMGVVMMVTER